MYTFIKIVTKENNILIKLPAGDACDQNNTTLSVFVELICDNEAGAITKLLNPDEFYNDECNKHLKLSTNAICNPVVYTSWVDIGDPCIFSIVLIVIGIFYLFYGYQMEEFTIPILLIIAVAALIHVAGPRVPVIACLSIGVVISLLTQIIEKFVYYIIIFILGNIISIFVLQLILHYFKDIYPVTIYSTTLTLTLIVLILTMNYIVNLLKLVMLSLLGSYLTIRVNILLNS
jgi:hypothetical protein